MKCVKIKVNGIVQGVGFRPFIYRIAHTNKLTGYVKNLGDAGVEIVVQGSDINIENFIKDLKLKAPPLARIQKINYEYIPPQNFKDFKIERSSRIKGEGNSIIPPDVAICDDCLKELFNPTDRRYMYPFIVCTNCGPRFSIIEDLPYDRDNTSMKDFPMCEKCREEYEDPLNRRYHAEPICCENCGPQYVLMDKNNVQIPGEPLKNAAMLIDKGYIIAIKGIGGFHIACDARNDETVGELRKRIRRKAQPFAIMAKDLNTIEEFAIIDDEEKEEINSYRRPITLLKKRDPFPLPDNLSPGLHTIGVMLPYTGLHYILFHHSQSDVYVMTSANYPDFPMIKDNDKIQEIKDAVDYFLIHNRRIVNRVDDSVVRFVDGERAVIRRSRGFVPLPVGKTLRYKGIAMGAELMNSFSIIKNEKIYPSQYIGNTSKIEVMDFFQKSLNRFRSLLNINDIDLVIRDSHPLYNTSQFGDKLGEEMDVEVLKVQHHFAHIASIMAEANIDEIIGIAIDAVGYGLDGNTWGGEIIEISNSGIKRLEHISYYPLPGGDLAAYYPIRSLMGLLSISYDEDEIEKIVKDRCPDAVNTLKYGNQELYLILKQLQKKINVAYTSSTGRLLDAVSVLLNVSYERTYEGEPAMKLESIAMGGQDLEFKIPWNKGIKVHQLFPQIINTRGSKKNIAYSVHTSLAKTLANAAIYYAEEKGIKKIGVSGGVAYNQIIMGKMRKIIKGKGYNFISTTEVPRGDNGISVGQAYIGGLYLNGYVRRDEIG